MMSPEPSGEDRSLVALEIEKSLGRSRVHDALEAVGFKIGSTWSHTAGERDRHAGEGGRGEWIHRVKFFEILVHRYGECRSDEPVAG